MIEKTEKEIRALEYPYNLLYLTLGNENPGNLSEEELIDGIDIITSDLALREQIVLKYRYQQNLTQQGVADLSGYSCGRVRSAEREIAWRIRRGRIHVKHTQEEVKKINEQFEEQKRREEAINTIEDFGKLKLSNLKLTSRLENILRWKGYKTLADVYNALQKDSNILLNIEGFGEKSQEEINNVIDEYLKEIEKIKEYEQ